MGELEGLYRWRSVDHIRKGLQSNLSSKHFCSSFVVLFSSGDLEDSRGAEKGVSELDSQPP
jgi:hypothetical protein